MTVSRQAAHELLESLQWDTPAESLFTLLTASARRRHSAPYRLCREAANRREGPFFGRTSAMPAIEWVNPRVVDDLFDEYERKLLVCDTQPYIYDGASVPMPAPSASLEGTMPPTAVNPEKAGPDTSFASLSPSLPQGWTIPDPQRSADPEEAKQRRRRLDESLLREYHIRLQAYAVAVADMLPGRDGWPPYALQCLDGVQPEIGGRRLTAVERTAFDEWARTLDGTEVVNIIAAADPDELRETLWWSAWHRLDEARRAGDAPPDLIARAGAGVGQIISNKLRELGFGGIPLQPSKFNPLECGRHWPYQRDDLIPVTLREFAGETVMQPRTVIHPVQRMWVPLTGWAQLCHERGYTSRRPPSRDVDRIMDWRQRPQ